MNKLSFLINELLLKEHPFNQENYFFDKFEKILTENEIKEKKFFLILNLVDFYEDAINHNFKELDSGYSIDQARKDLSLLSDILDKNDDVEIPEDLYRRLYKLSL